MIKPAFRTAGGHRRYQDSNIYSFVHDQKPNLAEKLTVCSSRVSSYDPKSDLVKKTSSLVAYCQQQSFLRVESTADLVVVFINGKHLSGIKARTGLQGEPAASTIG